MGTLSILGLVQEFCGLKGLPVPTALVGATTASVVQYRALLNQTLREAITCPWPELKFQDSFTTVAAADQGELTDLFPGFSAFVKDTIWLETETIPVRGPLTDSGWAALTALDISGPPYSFWLSNGHFYLTPTPSAGQTCTAVYTSDYKYYNGTTPKLEITADEDRTIVPDNVVLAGLCAYWAKAKGLDWQADMQAFETMLSRGLAPTQPTLSLDCSGDPSRPRIFIPPGSWMV